MKTASAALNGWPSLFPQKVKLIRTGEICENRGYYGNLFTLKLPNGRLAEVHRRELDLELRVEARAPHPHAPKPKAV
jgi:hypothetical protein